MIDRRELLLAFLLTALACLMTVSLFMRVANQESVGERTLLELPTEATRWAVMAAENCVGKLSYQVTQRELLWLEIEGKILLKYQQMEWPATVKAYFFFNQLHQLFSSTIKIKLESYSISLEVHDINPLRIALDVAGTTEPIRYETQLQGPFVLERGPTNRYFITSPHRIKRRESFGNLIPKDWPITMQELSVDTTIAERECASPSKSLDLEMLLPIAQRLFPALRIFPGQLMQDLQGAHA